MLKILIKKQFTELFRGFFYDQKKNTARTGFAMVLWIVLFVLLTVGMLGGIFTLLALSLCDTLTAVKLDWLYFLVFSLISVLLGVFGSVFNTHTVLYLAKDNDLLLAMPIPVRTIIVSRLLSVYLMGLMYSVLVYLPGMIVYWVVMPFDLKIIIGGVLLLFVISALVLVLSCALGWVVAKISLKIKNKSLITVAVSLLFIGGYYFVYFKAQTLIRDLAANAVMYGEKIKGAAYGLYMFGGIGAGDIKTALLCFAAVSVVLAGVWVLLSRSFYKIATASGKVAAVQYREKTAKKRSPNAALARREFARFLSSPNYILNCALGTILMPALGILLLIKGKELLGVLSLLLAERSGCIPVLFCAAVCMVCSMNDISAPSVSMEGKNLWLVKSLPVSSWQALRAKLVPHLLITLPPLAVCLGCGAAALYREGALTVALAVCTALAFCVLDALFGLMIGVIKPILSWTTEVIPIKQSIGVTVALFGGWGYALLVGGGYLLFGYRIGAAAFLGAALAVSVALCVLLWRWLKTRGTALFEAL